MIITEDIKLAELLVKNHHLLSIINRFDIKLGFGEKTIAQICADYTINVDFFLEIVNSFNDTNYFPKRELEKFPLSLIIDYLRKTHRFYLERKIPEIDALIQNLIDGSEKEHHKSIALIQKFYREYKDELILHIEREEKEVYPYILKLEKMYLVSDYNEVVKAFVQAYSIKQYLSEHDDIAEALLDLKSLLIKYLPPQENERLCYKILAQLDHLEQDIIDHSLLEDKVLVPRVIRMEELMRQKMAL